jgi:hypothetical protein
MEIQYRTCNVIIQKIFTVCKKLHDRSEISNYIKKEVYNKRFIFQVV